MSEHESSKGNQVGALHSHYFFKPFRSPTYFLNICKIARKPEEIAKLIEAGFEYICEHDGLKFFRKRK